MFLFAAAWSRDVQATGGSGGNIYYVQPHDKRGHSGSLANGKYDSPFATIQECIDRAETGPEQINCASKMNMLC